MPPSEDPSQKSFELIELELRVGELVRKGVFSLFLECVNLSPNINVSNCGGNGPIHTLMKRIMSSRAALVVCIGASKLADL